MDNDPLCAKNLICLEIGGAYMGPYIDSGEITTDELERADQAFRSFKSELSIQLERENGPDWVRTFILNKMRRRYQWASKKIKELEIENQEARQKGVSYKNRETYGKRIASLEKWLKEIEQTGIYYKQAEVVDAGDFISPIDVPSIRKKGFKHRLNMHFL